MATKSRIVTAIGGCRYLCTNPAHLRAEKAISTILAMRDRLFMMTKLPRNLRETGKVTEAA
jgi:alcohol dehydrogenase